MTEKSMTITLNEELTNNNLALVTILENGIKAEKKVKLDEFIKKLLVVHQVINDRKEEQYFIAQNENIIAVATKDNQPNKVLYYYPESIWDLVLHNIPIQVKLPSLIFEVYKNGDMRIFATKSSLGEAKKGILKLYRFNFPNMIGNNGLCFGTFKKKEIELSDVKSYIREVMMVPYTHNMPSNVIQDKETGIYEYIITGNELSQNNLLVFI